MDKYDVFPDIPIKNAGVISAQFLSLGIGNFIAACSHVFELPYGYNGDRDDLLAIFKEGKGTCSTKHAVIATLAKELDLNIFKHVGIYAMTDDIVTGAAEILAEYRLPYLPMLHCFLVFGDRCVDLTEGNQNGKNRPINDFLHTQRVIPAISAKDEYLLYRKAVKDRILLRREMNGVDIKRILRAREKGLALLKARIT